MHASHLIEVLKFCSYIKMDPTFHHYFILVNRTFEIITWNTWIKTTLGFRLQSILIIQYLYQEL